jgi:hypothetical protein
MLQRGALRQQKPRASQSGKSAEPILPGTSLVPSFKNWKQCDGRF